MISASLKVLTFALLTTALFTLPSSASPAAFKTTTDLNEEIAAPQIVTANPDKVFAQAPPPVLFAIPILKVSVDRQGLVTNVDILREPMNPAAQDTVQMAIEAVLKAQPYQGLIYEGDTARFVQTFLYREDRLFLLRVLNTY
jgi:hypothetical protein